MPTIPSLKKSRKSAAVVGLEIEAGSIGAVEANVNGQVKVTASATCPIPPGAFSDGEVTDPATITAALEELFSANKLSRKVRLGIANQRVVVRTLRLPAIENPDELAAAVRFAAQEQIAMPLDQAVVDHRVVGGVGAVEGSGPQVDVMVVAARRDMISASLKPVRDAGLDPVGVDLSAFGMIRALASAAQDPPEGQAGAVLYCSVSDVTNLAVANGRSCLFTRVAPAGLGDIAGSLASATGLTPEHARMWLDHVGLQRPVGEIEGDPETIARTRTALDQGAAAMVDELRLSLDFYGAQEGAAPVEKIVLCGPASAIPGLADHMTPTLGLPI
ncbi:MAG TPA: type IV pilus assembly protein PilM, partial [Solirubrobacterales bacterium]|nr:type IV pilus assembly protein PilM [Solirubrobacterales bacterium]